MLEGLKGDGTGQNLQNQSRKQVTDNRIMVQCGSPVNLNLWLSWETWDKKAKPEKHSGNREDISHLLLVILLLVDACCC